MKQNRKTYWKGVEQLANDPEVVKNAGREFPEFLPTDNGEEGNTRRDFLKMMGFGIAAASLAACEAPVRKAIPYVNKPVDVDPGIPNYYASTYASGGDYCSIVVKTREGRPIKIEGNDLSTISRGATTTQAEASVLSLYDNERLRGPKIGETISDWETIDKEIIKKLEVVALQGGKISLVSNTILSPATLQVIEDFKAKYPTTEHITYDTASAFGILKANEQSFGKAMIPSMDFSKADVIVSLGADFLGDWLSHIEFTKQYSKTRKLYDGKKSMSRHFQFETNLSLTGSNADYRTPIKPSQEGLVVAALYNLIAAKAGVPAIFANIKDIANLEKAANELWNAKGKSLVVSGSNDPAVQVVVNGINYLLENYGQTIDISTPLYYRKGNDQAMDRFIDEVKGGRIGAVIFYNCNPVYNHLRGKELSAALEKVSLKISTSDREDETASKVDYIVPDHHYLESWNDACPKKDHYSLTQPTISPLFKTRQVQESLLKWAGKDSDYFTYLKDYWRVNRYTEASGAMEFQYFWDKSLQDGVFVVEVDVESAGTEDLEMSFAGDLNGASQAISRNYKASQEGLELALYKKLGIGDGTQANNPWLQELPDPISKATWDNYLTLSQRLANELGITSVEGKTNMARLTVGQNSYELPVLVQPGQAPGTVGLAIGYGRTHAGVVANGRGVDAYPLATMLNGAISYNVTSGVRVEKLDKRYQVAQTQTHQTHMGRETVVQEATLGAYQKDPKAGRYHPHISTWQEESGETNPGSLSLWKGHKYDNHHWGLAIDLNTCTGCSACVIACHAENNVPVVGREEVIKRRDMHWLRIDRYYSSDNEVTDLKGLEEAAENPEVTFQPMMCQHCNNAPCETVCPVAATTHSTEGLNQMTYNRCIGTRYCANNCPYKVRRFNWFKYHDNKQFADSNTPMNNDLGKMVLNPDVTVRSRGVMEKCSFCVQRIQYGKLEAKKEGRRLKDGDVKSACASACPSEALVFGDMNDPESKIYKMLKIKDTEVDHYITDKEIGEPRAYHVLDEVGTKPNVVYLTKIRNKEESEA